MQFIGASTECLAVSSGCWSGAPVTRAVNEEGGHLCVHGWGGTGRGGGRWKQRRSGVADGLILVVMAMGLEVRVRFPNAWSALVLIRLQVGNVLHMSGGLVPECQCHVVALLQ